MVDNGSVRGVILAGDDDAGSVVWGPCPGLLLPLANTPLVERILGEYAGAGVHETLIAAGRDTREIESLCADGSRWDMTLTYLTDRNDPKGQGLNEIVRKMAAFTKDAPFLVTPGPMLVESEVYSSLVHSFRECHPCGIRTRRTGRKPGNAAGDTGIYLLTHLIYDMMSPRITDSMSPPNSDSMSPRITDSMSPPTSDSEAPRISDPGALHDTDARESADSIDVSTKILFDSALDELAARGETVLDRDLAHPPYKVGSPEAYLDSNERLLASGGVSGGASGGALGGASGGASGGVSGGVSGGASAGEETGEEAELPEIMADNFSSPNLVLRPPVVVDASAELERCRIGPGVCIGPGVHIGHGAAIEHSVVMEGADIGDGASISYAIIGRNASIENRAVLHGRADCVRVVRSR